MDVVGVAVGAVLKQCLPLLVHAWPIQQTLQFIGSSEGREINSELRTTRAPPPGSHAPLLGRALAPQVGRGDQLLSRTHPQNGPIVTLPAGGELQS